MIKGLQECPLSYAISVDPEKHYSWIEQFWTKARSKKGSSRITLEIDGLKVTVAEEVIRKALEIEDNANDPCTTFTKEQIADYLEEIGYDVKWSTCEKKHLFIGSFYFT